jgi:hypothetical protein
MHGKQSVAWGCGWIGGVGLEGRRGAGVGHTTGLLDNIICLCEESGDDEPVWSGRLHETKHDVMWGMCVRMVER